MTITALERRQIRAAERVLARAFMEDPAFGSLWPESAAREPALRHLMGVPLADGLNHGHVDVAIDDDELVGAAVWYPPGGYPLSPWRKARATPHMLAIALTAPGSFRRLSRMGRNVDATFPHDRPWYLAVVGVAPEAQGAGVGRRLLEHGLARVDADTHLETDAPRAAELYERLGFRTTEPAVQLLPDGPPHRLMRHPHAR